MGVVAIGDVVDVVVEVPRGTRVKWGSDGRVAYVSPVPSPFDYGAVPDRLGGDGDPLDALVLGPPRRRGERVTARVLAIVAFDDAGRVDDKLICGPWPLVRADRDAVATFFRRYAVVKRWASRLRGRRGATRFVGWIARTR